MDAEGGGDDLVIDEVSPSEDDRFAESIVHGEGKCHCYPNHEPQNNSDVKVEILQRVTNLPVRSILNQSRRTPEAAIFLHPQLLIVSLCVVDMPH